MDKVFYGTLSKQRNRYIITGSIKAKDLLDVYKIDEWKYGKSLDEQGCQRPPIPAHYKKIGRQFEKNDFWLPTSIVMSESARINGSDKEIFAFNDDSFIVERVKTNLEIPIVKVTLKNSHKLRIVDGQHRIKGIEYAMLDKKIPGLDDFELPYVLMLTKNRVDEIQSFYEINSTPKKVATDLALQLLNEIQKSKDRANVKLPTSKFNKLIALRAAMDLNQDENSVWKNNISVGKTKDSIAIASSTSFVNSLKPLISGKRQSKLILSAITGIYDNNAKTTKSRKSKDKMGDILAEIINNYWNALKEIMPELFPDDPDDRKKWVIQKTPGVFSLNEVAGKVLDLMFYRDRIKELTPNNIAKFLKKYGETGINDYKSYWKGSDRRHRIIGGRASNANSQQGFKQLASEIYDDIEENYNDAHDARPMF